MKQLLVSLILFVALATNAVAQVSTVSTFSATTYAKATSRTDTSATVSVGAYPFIGIATTSTGSDSTAMTVTIDGLMNGVWSNLLTSAALNLGRAAGHTLASTKGQAAFLVLRDGSRIADLLQGATSIRVRNVITSGANDSASALTYTQKVVLRKP